MKPEAQRIAIAELCGFVWYRIPHSEKQSRGPLRSLFLPTVHEFDQSPIWLVRADGTERIANWEYMHDEGQVPDYLNDLNATDKMEEHLNGEEWDNYFDAIRTWGRASGVRATAAQRCEQFLRAKGKWVEDKQ